ncbi:MAG: hypothetical protein PVG71_13355 [Anaerolineae bacterium]|jgi:hypothetical protein
MSKLTTLGRPIDPSYPTNLAIAIITFLVTLGGALFQQFSGTGWLVSALWGAQAGLTVFLAWALCRELDPDHAVSAFVAAGLASVGLFLWDLPHLWALFWLLLVMRVVNRTAGLPAGLLDALAVLILGGWLSLRGNWGYGALTALAFCLDSVLPPATLRRLVFAAVGLVVTVGVAVLGAEARWEEAPSLAGGLIGLGISAVFLPVVAGAGRLDSVGDWTGEPLEPIRVRAAQAVALLTGVEVAVLGGMAGLVALMPLWAAVLGAGIYRVVLAVRS